MNLTRRVQCQAKNKVSMNETKTYKHRMVYTR